jgi:hypothetical protein
LAAWLSSLTALWPRHGSQDQGADLPTPITSLHRRAPASNRRAGLPCRVPPSLLSGGAGILTGCPSSTPLGLDLGPPNPTRIDLPSETLDLRRTRFSRVLRYSYRHSHFCTLHCSSRYSFYACRTLPYQSNLMVAPRGFGAKLEPRYIFRAGPLDQ